MSGDGAFLMSAMELETAVRLKCNFVHMVWRDGYYWDQNGRRYDRDGRPCDDNDGYNQGYNNGYGQNYGYNNGYGYNQGYGGYRRGN